MPFPEAAMTTLPVYRPFTESPGGYLKTFTVAVTPMAGPGPAGLFVQVVSIGGEAERDLGDARVGLHDIFRLLTAQPARMTASEMRREYAQIVEWSETTGRPVFITNHGRPEAVLLSFGLYGRVLKAISRIGLRLSGKRSRLAQKADDLIEAETKALSGRLRRGESR
jgi:prevent-host-death family protein